MKVILTLKDHSIGGVTRYVYDLYNALKKEGFDVNITEQISHNKNFYTILRYFRNLGKNGENAIFHFNSFYDYSVYSLLNFIERRMDKIRKKKNVVLTVHSVLPIEYFVTYRKIPLKWSSIVFKSQKLSRYFSDSIVAPSNIIKKQLILYGFNPDKIEVIHHGVSMRYFDCADLDKFNDMDIVKIIYFNPSVRKGLKIFINWTRNNLLHFEQFDVERMLFYVIGNDKTLRTIKQSLPKLHNTNVRIKFFENPTDEKLCELYRESHFIIMPSLYEPFGMTALEAMASGTIPVVSHRCGVSEIIDSEHDGFIMDIDNFFADFIYILSNTKYSKFKRMSKNAIRKAKKYRWGNVVKKYIKLYHNMY